MTSSSQQQFDKELDEILAFIFLGNPTGIFSPEQFKTMMAKQMEYPKLAAAKQEIKAAIAKHIINPEGELKFSQHFPQSLPEYMDAVVATREQLREEQRAVLGIGE